jgi:hypothetical protein
MIDYLEQGRAINGTYYAGRLFWKVRPLVWLSDYRKYIGLRTSWSIPVENFLSPLNANKISWN